MLSFGDYESYGQNTDGAAVGYIWRYKLVSHVKNAAPAVDNAEAGRGSQAAPYRTLKYAINRGQAPVVVLMTGSHEGVGNANVVVAGPSMGKAPVNDGYGSPCHLAVATTLPFALTPSSNSALETDGRQKRQTCVGPLIIAGQNNAHLDGTRVSNDAADVNVVAAALGPVEKCQRKCAELEHCCSSSPYEARTSTRPASRLASSCTTGVGRGPVHLVARRTGTTTRSSTGGGYSPTTAPTARAALGRTSSRSATTTARICPRVSTVTTGSPGRRGTWRRRTRAPRSWGRTSARARTGASRGRRCERRPRRRRPLRAARSSSTPPGSSSRAA